MRERALVHVAGPAGVGKTGLIERLLAAEAAFAICVRAEHDPKLRKAQESSPKAHEELRRYHDPLSACAMFGVVLQSELIERLRERLSRERDIDAAWLFGSVARGEARGSSDVDVAILTHAKPTGTLADLWLDLADELTKSVGRPVDLVVMDRAPDDLVHRVLRDGELLLETDRAARVRFEVASRSRYFDMQPIWQRYREGRI